MRKLQLRSVSVCWLLVSSFPPKNQGDFIKLFFFFFPDGERFLQVCMGS